jgi:hypothetical protein
LQSVAAQRACSGDPPAHSTPATDLDGRCVLCVDGRTDLFAQYRLVVEHCRGEFIHHDGGLEDKARRLQALLANGDAVVCVAGTVSHRAYYAVKRYCKHERKPCVLLRNASLSSFVNGIRALGGSASTRAPAVRCSLQVCGQPTSVPSIHHHERSKEARHNVRTALHRHDEARSARERVIVASVPLALDTEGFQCRA